MSAIELFIRPTLEKLQQLANTNVKLTTEQRTEIDNLEGAAESALLTAHLGIDAAAGMLATFASEDSMPQSDDVANLCWLIQDLARTSNRLECARGHISDINQRSMKD